MRSMLPSPTSAPRAGFLALALAATGGAGAAQFDTLPFPAGSVAVLEDGVLSVDDGTTLYAFGSFGQEFVPLAPTGTRIASGAHVVYAKEGGGDRVAYSARRHESAKLAVPAGTSVVHEVVGDDVVLVVLDTGGALVAWGYSAWTNAWQPRTLTATTLPATDVVAAGYAVAVVDQTVAGPRPFGFSARQGAWTAGPLGVTVTGLVGDGNVVACVLDDGLAEHVAAFSGVHGLWTLSSGGVDVTTLAVDHNVAFVEAPDGGGQVKGEAYSAYECTWLQSPVTHPLGSVVAHLADNHVALEEPVAGFGSRWEAIGALRGAGGWVGFGGPQSALRVASTDGLVIADGLGLLYGFSGLVGDAWHPEAVAPPVAFSAPPDGTLLTGRDTVDVSHVFDCVAGVWAPPFNHNGPPGTLTAGRASAVAVDAATGRAWGYGPRFGAWVPGPLWPAATAHAAHGSLNSLVQPATGDTLAWDTRRDQFSPTLPLGAGAATSGDGELLVAEGPASTWMYSVRRGTWEEVVGSAGPVGGGVFVDVAAEVGFVLAAGELVAFGAAGDTHVWAAHPEGTEYLAYGLPGGVPSTPVHHSLRAEAGQLVALLYDGARLPFGVALGAAVTGLYHLGGVTFAYTAGPLAADHHHALVPLGAGPAGGGPTSVWLQSVTRTVGVFPPYALAIAPEPVLVR